MRLIRTLVARDDLESVRDVLDEQGVDYVVSEVDDDAVVVEFPLPTQAVELVLDSLRDTGHEDRYTVIVEAQSAIAEHFDELEDRFVTGDEEDESLAPEEIRATALDLTPSPVTYYSMTLLSAVVATAGLLLDSPAVVVGSMVIAPLVGSALTASVGTVLAERELILDGFRTQVSGLLLSVFGAAAFGAALRTASLLPAALQITTINQISQRISPGLLSVLVGICAGAAGAFSLATGVSAALVGVMIAAALIPAAAAVGIGIAWGLPSVGTGAALLLVLNAVAIHVSAVLVFWKFGYRPAGWEASSLGSAASSASEHLGPSVAVVAGLVVIAVVTGAVLTAHVGFERSVNDAVDDLLEDPRYEELELLSTRVEFDSRLTRAADERPRVTVVASRPADVAYPDLAERIAARVEARTGRRVRVVVEFVDQQRFEPARRAGGPAGCPCSTRSATPSAPGRSDSGGPRLVQPPVSAQEQP
ncbi:MAG: TIGR00341 family protein [Haloarculaceae archaeon]